MKRKIRQKIQIVLNIVLTVFSLFALTVSMFAWFSTRQYANLHSVDLKVDRQEIIILQQPNSYLFSCATKIGDVTEADFDTYCYSSGTYVIKGEGQLYVDITNKDGVLGYVCDGTEGSDLYKVITNKLKTQLGVDDLSNQSFDAIRDALRVINLSRPVGITNAEGNTEIKIVCWTEYSKFSSQLNKKSNGVYVYNQVANLNVDVTFIV